MLSWGSLFIYTTVWKQQQQKNTKTNLKKIFSITVYLRRLEISKSHQRVREGLLRNGGALKTYVLAMAL